MSSGERPVRIDSPWLGSRRGRLTDWTTQRWVQLTGRRVNVVNHPWLDPVAGDTDVIGTEFFDRVAAREGLDLRENGAPRGLVTDMRSLDGHECRVDRLAPDVVDFYEQTSEYELDAWSRWCGPFRPFGKLLAILFSRRLQQLNVPLNPLDTSRGITSRVVQLCYPDGTVRRTAWIRKMAVGGNTLYNGSYSTCRVPGYASPCVRVVFPLPNGNAHVILKPRSGADGSLTLSSRGKKFGDPGFYFFVRADAKSGWVRYVASMKEDIVVSANGDEDPRADHLLNLWGMRFMELHYRMRRTTPR